MKFQASKGTYDVMPDQAHLWQHIESVIREQARLYGFKEIRTPVFENTALFVKGTGDATDIVQKEMYTFTDKGQRSITLRPEGTPPVLRALIEHNSLKEQPYVKVFYLAPMFRYERPQAGRMRQHTQFGVEIVGPDSPVADIEAISVLFSVLQKLGLSGLKLRLNSVGCRTCHPAYREKLVAHFKPKLGGLCDNCKDRINRNPLRILDCKIDREKVLDAPAAIANLCPACAAHFEKVRSLLGDLDIPFVIDNTLVRGLDYYTRTVFEVASAHLGAQDALGGGGRYDGLVEELGGDKAPGVGFASGLERYLLALKNQGANLPQEKRPDVYIATLGDEAVKKGNLLCSRLRQKGLICEQELLGRSLKAQLREAGRLNARYVALIGEDEIKKGVVTLKDMDKHEQAEVAFDEIMNNVPKYCQCE
ncbi:histidine--tRNA ligase [candidate division TA06 bacterium]|uniref:Histidine--tRNA ligase n=1 Tax=candidate division TA06 bacterium TaxID=2250710 RepID=A0A933MKH4_UNCT6|nr:histidine--tRNA ligase [candidate division TA06 bacterium]